MFVVVWWIVALFWTMITTCLTLHDVNTNQYVINSVYGLESGDWPVSNQCWSTCAPTHVWHHQPSQLMGSPSHLGVAIRKLLRCAPNDSGISNWREAMGQMLTLIMAFYADTNQMFLFSFQVRDQVTLWSMVPKPVKIHKIFPSRLSKTCRQLVVAWYSGRPSHPQVMPSQPWRLKTCHVWR